MLHKVSIAGMTMDPASNTPIIILKSEDDDRAIPIWIGLLEATSIASALQDIKLDRPMTHDLIYNILMSLESKVVKIVVNDLKESTYYGLIYLNRGGKDLVIDSRPSDAIAIALVADAPIFVSEQVIEKARTIDMEKEGDQLKEWLENLNPEDFKYKA